MVSKGSLHHDAHEERHAVANDHELGAAAPQVLQVGDELCGRIDVALGVSLNPAKKNTFRIPESEE